MAKYIKVTDTSAAIAQVGYHDVDDDFVLPLPTRETAYEFVSEDVARKNHPALFGEVVEVVVPPRPAKNAAK